LRDYARIALILRTGEETSSWGTRDLIRENATFLDMRSTSADHTLVTADVRAFGACST